MSVVLAWASPDVQERYRAEERARHPAPGVTLTSAGYRDAAGRLLTWHDGRFVRVDEGGHGTVARTKAVAADEMRMYWQRIAQIEKAAPAGCDSGIYARLVEASYYGRPVEIILKGGLELSGVVRTVNGALELEDARGGRRHIELSRIVTVRVREKITKVIDKDPNVRATSRGAVMSVKAAALPSTLRSRSRYTRKQKKRNREHWARIYALERDMERAEVVRKAVSALPAGVLPGGLLKGA